MTRRVVGAIFLLVSQLLVLGCTRPSPVQEPVTIYLNIPDTPFMALLPFYVADEKGFFKANGLTVRWIPVPDPGQARNLLVAGDAELTLSTFANLLPLHARDPNVIELIMPFYESSKSPGSFLLVRRDSPIKSVRSLKGRTVGTYTGPSQKVYAEIVLNRLGYSVPDDIKLVQVSTELQVQAFLGGAFDVFFAVEPFATSAMNKGAIKLEAAVRPKYIMDPFWVGSAAVRKQFLLSNPGVKHRLEQSLKLAIEYINTRPGEVREILSRRARVEPTVAKTTELYTWVLFPSKQDCKQIQEHADLLFDKGLLESKVLVAQALPTCAQQ